MPIKCTACVFYSRIRKRCIKLGKSVPDPENPPCLSSSTKAPKVKEDTSIVPKTEGVKASEKIELTKPEKRVEEVPTKVEEHKKEVKKKEHVKLPSLVSSLVIRRTDERREELVKVVDELLKTRRELEEYLTHYFKSRDALLSHQVVKIGSTQLSERDIALALKELEEKKNRLHKRFMDLDRKAVELGAIRCPVCSFPLPPNSKKCLYCGYSVKLKS